MGAESRYDPNIDKAVEWLRRGERSSLIGEREEAVGWEPDAGAHNVTSSVNPSMSSWGFQGYSETWLMHRNHWIYPALYNATDAFRALAAESGQRDGLRHAALDQYLRELLLAQASDWAFILHAQTASEYATQRVKGHLANMTQIQTALEQDRLDSRWLASLRDKNNIFADVDLLECYRKSVSSGLHG